MQSCPLLQQTFFLTPQATLSLQSLSCIATCSPHEPANISQNPVITHTYTYIITYMHFKVIAVYVKIMFIYNFYGHVHVTEVSCNA